MPKIVKIATKKKVAKNFMKVQISLRFDEFFHRKQSVAKGDFLKLFSNSVFMHYFFEHVVNDLMKVVPASSDPCVH